MTTSAMKVLVTGGTSSLGLAVPRQVCQSDRHTPLAPTAMTAPSAGQAGSGTCVSSGTIP